MLIIVLPMKHNDLWLDRNIQPAPLNPDRAGVIFRKPRLVKCGLSTIRPLSPESIMELPEYISKKEVGRVCQELGIRDWSELTEPRVNPEEAQRIQRQIGAETSQIPLEAFRQGLEVELEHGLVFPDANVTQNHPLLTGMIVLAHLKEMLDYYERLTVAELEGDLLKAAASGDAAALLSKYQKLVAARAGLHAREQTKLNTD